ncbi:hypothetical protein [Bartonella schoenbuchensis]
MWGLHELGRKGVRILVQERRGREFRKGAGLRGRVGEKRGA